MTQKGDMVRETVKGKAREGWEQECIRNKPTVNNEKGREKWCLLSVHSVITYHFQSYVVCNQVRTLIRPVTAL